MAQTETEIVQGIGSDYTSRRLAGGSGKTAGRGAGFAGAVFGGASGN